MSRLSRGIADLLIPDTTGQRALDETLEDWRQERALAESTVARLRADSRGVRSLVSFYGAVCRVEVASRGTWRAFGWSVLAATLGAVVMPFSWGLAGIGAFGFTAGELAALTVLLVPNGLAALFSAAAAIGLGQRPGRPVRLLGNMILSFAFVLVVLNWLVPAANQAFRERVWSEARQDVQQVVGPARGANELSLPQLIRTASRESHGDPSGAKRALSVRAALTVAAPTFVLFGGVLRQRASRRLSWRLAQLTGGVATVAIAAVGTYGWSVIGHWIPWPAATQLERLNAELWLSLLIAWMATIVLLSCAEPRNPNLAPGT